MDKATRIQGFMAEAILLDIESLTITMRYEHALEVLKELHDYAITPTLDDVYRLNAANDNVLDIQRYLYMGVNLEFILLK